MVERIPVYEPLALQRLVAPLEHLEVVLGRMVAGPVDELESTLGLFRPKSGYSCLPLRTPYLYRPGEDAQVVVHPVVEDPGDDLLGVVAEVVKDRDSGVAGEVGPFLADRLVGPEILGRERLVAQRAVGAEQDAAVGMERDAAGDIGVARDEGDDGVDLRLAGWKRPRAALLVLQPPVRREVAVQVQALLIG